MIVFEATWVGFNTIETSTRISRFLATHLKSACSRQRFRIVHAAVSGLLIAEPSKRGKRHHPVGTDDDQTFQAMPDARKSSVLTVRPDAVFDDQVPALDTDLDSVAEQRYDPETKPASLSLNSSVSFFSVSRVNAPRRVSLISCVRCLL